MKLSQSGIGVTRLQNLDEMFPAQDILLQSGQLVQYGAGIFGYHNVPLLLRQTIENITREVLNKYGCIEILLPTLQPEAIWQASGRWEKYLADGTMLTVNTSKGNFGLAPTAEEAVVEFAKKKIKSYKDLPTTLYQIGEKYRNEIRNRGYILRGKTFPMMDAYSFNLDEEDLVKTYANIREAYIELFSLLGLDAIPVVADNGAIGGKKSEEFMIISDAGEDTILFDKVSGRYLNSEILEKENYEEYLKTEYGIENVSQLEEKRALELGHIFQLGTKYSETMNANYIDKEGKEKPFYMGCYGIGITRLLAAIYENSLLRGKDNEPNGIALPTKFAPYFVQIIAKPDNSEKVSQAEKLYNTLTSRNIPVIIDDRTDITLGSKLKDCKLLGTPYMVVLGDKVDDGFVEVENTATGNKTVMSQDELVQKLAEMHNFRINKQYNNIKELI